MGAELCLSSGPRVRRGGPVTTAHAGHRENAWLGHGCGGAETYAFWCETLQKNESKYLLIKEGKEERHPWTKA